MRGYFEAQKKHLLEQVSDNNPEVEQRLKEAFGKALDAAFEDLEKNGVQPDSEERFWKNLSQTLSGCGCLRHGYRYFENVTGPVWKTSSAAGRRRRTRIGQKMPTMCRYSGGMSGTAINILRSSSPPSRRSCGRSCGKTAWAARRSAAF